MPSAQAKLLHASSLQEELLHKMAHRTPGAQRLVKRAQIVLKALKGTSNTSIAQHLLGDAPAIEVRIVTLTQVLHLPRGAAMGLFVLGRTIGWIGHAIEEYQAHRLIRPRALC